MTRRSANRSGDADGHVVELLTEFAQYLIAAGTSSARFVHLSQIAYFRAASETAVLQNKRINQSAIAAMTGLTRVQVRALARQPGPQPGYDRDRTENVVQGWMADAQFVRADLNPRQLSLTGSASSFSQLVRKYGGDVTPKAMLKELVRKGYVTVRGTYARLTPEVSESRAQARLRQVTGALVKLLRGSGKNTNSRHPLRTHNYEIQFPATSAKGAILLQKRFAERLQQLLAELQAAGSAASIEAPASAIQAGKVTRARLALLSEDLG